MFQFDSQDITLRPVAEQDEPFLYLVYAETRAAEMALVPWSQAEKTEFLEMQFRAQDTYYRQHFPDAQFLIIERASQAIGRLYIDYVAEEIRVIDIALLTTSRGQGIGGELMQAILQDAQQRQLPVRIHVERNNVAHHLYERLGFQKIEETGVYDFMEWRPEQTPGKLR